MQPSWRPANATERMMSEALGGTDHRDYFDALTRAELLLPTTGADLRAGRSRLATLTVDGRTMVLVFTSRACMEIGMGGRADEAVPVTYPELADNWPDRTWWLAVDPGTPIQGYFPIGAPQRAATGGELVPRVDDLAAAPDPETLDFEPYDDFEERLRTAYLGNDIDVFFAVLLEGEVILPVRQDLDPMPSLRSPDFPWWMEKAADLPVLPVFSAVERARERLGAQVPVVRVDGLDLIRGWPSAARCLSVNPGSAVTVTLPPDAVQELRVLFRQTGTTATHQPVAGQLGADRSSSGSTPVVPTTSIPATPVPSAPPEPALVQLEQPLSETQLRTYLPGGAHRFSGSTRVRLENDAPDHPTAGYLLRWHELSSQLPPADPATPGVRNWPGTVALPHGARLYRKVTGPRWEIYASYDADVRCWVALDGTEVAAGGDTTSYDGWVADWRGSEYEASPDGPLVRLYSTEPRRRFDRVLEHRYRHIVAADEVTLSYRRSTALWRGDRVAVLAARGDTAHIEYAGDTANPQLQNLMLAGPGIRQGWVRQAELTGLRREPPGW